MYLATVETFCTVIALKKAYDALAMGYGINTRSIMALVRGSIFFSLISIPFGPPSSMLRNVSNCHNEKLASGSDSDIPCTHEFRRWPLRE